MMMDLATSSSSPPPPPTGEIAEPVRDGLALIQREYPWLSNVDGGGMRVSGMDTRDTLLWFEVTVAPLGRNHFRWMLATRKLLWDVTGDAQQHELWQPVECNGQLTPRQGVPGRSVMEALGQLVIPLPLIRATFDGLWRLLGDTSTSPEVVIRTSNTQRIVWAAAFEWVPGLRLLLEMEVPGPLKQQTLFTMYMRETDDARQRRAEEQREWMRKEKCPVLEKARAVLPDVKWLTRLWPPGEALVSDMEEFTQASYEEWLRHYAAAPEWRLVNHAWAHLQPPAPPLFEYKGRQGKGPLEGFLTRLIVESFRIDIDLPARDDDPYDADSADFRRRFRDTRHEEKGRAFFSLQQQQQQPGDGDDCAEDDDEDDDMDIEEC